MAVLDEIEDLLVAQEVAGSIYIGAILTATSSDASAYLANDGSSNAQLTRESTAEAFYLTASSSGVEITATSTDQSTYLVDEFPVWALFKSHLPDSTVLPDRAVAIIETMGEGVMGRVGIELPGLQVVVRGAPQNVVTDAFSSAATKAMEIHDALHGYAGSSDTTTHYAGIWCRSGPAFSGFDESWRPYFTADFRVMRSST